MFKKKRPFYSVALSVVTLPLTRDSALFTRLMLTTSNLGIELWRNVEKAKLSFGISPEE